MDTYDYDCDTEDECEDEHEGKIECNEDDEDKCEDKCEGKKGEIECNEDEDKIENIAIQDIIESEVKLLEDIENDKKNSESVNNFVNNAMDNIMEEMNLIKHFEKLIPMITKLVNNYMENPLNTSSTISSTKYPNYKKKSYKFIVESYKKYVLNMYNQIYFENIYEIRYHHYTSKYNYNMQTIKEILCPDNVHIIINIDTRGPVTIKLINKLVYNTKKLFILDPDVKQMYNSIIEYYKYGKASRITSSRYTEDKIWKYLPIKIIKIGYFAVLQDYKDRYDDNIPNQFMNDILVIGRENNSVCINLIFRKESLFPDIIRNSTMEIHFSKIYSDVYKSLYKYYREPLKVIKFTSNYAIPVFDKKVVPEYLFNISSMYRRILKKEAANSSEPHPYIKEHKMSQENVSYFIDKSNMKMRINFNCLGCPVITIRNSQIFNLIQIFKYRLQPHYKIYEEYEKNNDIKMSSTILLSFEEVCKHTPIRFIQREYLDTVTKKSVIKTITRNFIKYHIRITITNNAFAIKLEI